MANIKVYKARSEVSLCAVLGEGRNIHISFDPITGGGSTYRTGDPEIQTALEHHNKYGKLFRLDQEIESKPVKTITPPVKIAETQTDDTSNDTVGEAAEENSEEEGESTDNITVVPVTCINDAKDYLADNLGVSRTSLRSKAKVEAAAAENGIRFEGLEN